ncbi:hypothetical protein SAMN06269185_2909 [Natronoarchaeum philippinense]|uniref:Uncharacterized protein n=1 Tax=Natronoarchaeum philippinense TaxID=558529 RepID=A0A285P7J1_NATPI|nr:hypothetical protein [Natronoarchaeum philippinense]SNZ17173.1 hypothetical protein SAMN06269185_2909 [Natronoarchaeum philippinense]
MRERQRFHGDASVLHRNAVRTPLPDADAERLFHRNMLSVAEGRERKAELLVDPDVSLLDAYERELERVAESFERRLRQFAGEGYEEIALATQRGERDDRIGRLTSYYFEGLWRIQQRTTISEMLFFPIILRYPDSFTMNVRFASGYATTESVLYESPAHSTEQLDDEHAETYYEESAYSQRKAAAYLRETAQIIRDEFPDPDESDVEDRYGGIVSAGGRRGSTFSAMLKRVEPDPGRFSSPADETMLVSAGPEARRTADELLDDDAVFL